MSREPEYQASLGDGSRVAYLSGSTVPALTTPCCCQSQQFFTVLRCGPLGFIRGHNQDAAVSGNAFTFLDLHF